MSMRDLRATVSRRPRFGHFWAEADIDLPTPTAESVENDPQQTFRSAFVWFRNMRGGLLLKRMPQV
ncbi:hypothetical protein AC630_24130 [Bradyrhizobium sp. AS23.2]|nr:hypothetical protein AC630_24130 [Bradyrhizobium sp. AS23.2]